MTAPSDLSCDRVAYTQLSDLQAAMFRVPLLVRLEEESARLGRDSSSGRDERPRYQPTCPACGSPATVADAPDAVRRLDTLATTVLRGGTQEHPWRILGSPPTPGWSALERVARFRDELHVTANRIARFEVDERPTVDPVRVAAPAAVDETLAPEQLLFQLDLAADRLIALLDRLSADDWARTGQMGDGLVTLGELVNSALHLATHGLLDLVQDSPVLVRDGVSAITKGLRSRADRRATRQAQHNDSRRSRTSRARRPDPSAHLLSQPDRRDAHVPRYSLTRGVH